MKRLRGSARRTMQRAIAIAAAGASACDRPAPPETERTARSEGGSSSPERAGDWAWLPGEWAPAAGVPDFCEVRVATHPARDVPPLQWRACASGGAGCRRLVVDWASGRGSALAVDVVEPVRRLRSGGAVVQVTRRYPDPHAPTFDRTMHVLYDVDGAARFAYAVDLRDRGGGAGSQRCLGVVSASEEGLVVRTDLIRERVSRFSWAAWTDPQRFTVSREVAADELNGGAGLQVHGGSAVYVSTQLTGGLATFDLRSQRVTVPRDGASAAPIEGARPVGQGAVGFRLAERVFLDLVEPDGSTTRLVTPPGGRHVSGFAVDRSDADRLVWVEADGLQPATGTVLFTAPAADREAALRRQRVTAFADPGGDGGGHMIANAGHALLLTGPTQALLVRLSDGRRWTIAADPGTVFVQPMWVDDREVWIATGVLPYPGSEAIDVGSIVRWSREAPGWTSAQRAESGAATTR
jgi:hypothetical protein